MKKCMKKCKKPNHPNDSRLPVYWRPAAAAAEQKQLIDINEHLSG